jgi:tetratricopeptide (TPR) repeat protein
MKAQTPFTSAVARSLLATTYWLKGDKAAAQPLFVQAEHDLKDVRAKGNDAPAIPFWLAQIEARLGHRNEVERELQLLFRATQEDRWGYPRPEEAAARAYTILGDIDKALPMLARAISQPTQWCLTPAILQFDPNGTRCGTIRGSNNSSLHSRRKNRLSNAPVATVLLALFATGFGSRA